MSTDPDDFGIGRAVRALRRGLRIARHSWENGRWIELQQPHEFAGDRRLSRVTQPVLLMHTPTGDLAPWSCPHEDVLADDWRVIR